MPGNRPEENGIMILPISLCRMIHHVKIYKRPSDIVHLVDQAVFNGTFLQGLRNYIGKTNKRKTNVRFSALCASSQSSDGSGNPYPCLKHRNLLLVWTMIFRSIETIHNAKGSPTVLSKPFLQILGWATFHGTRGTDMRLESRHDRLGQESLAWKQ